MKQIDQAFFMACAFFQLTGLAQPLTESPDKIFLARPLWCEHAPEAGLVYVCTAGDLYALEEKTGALRWKKDGSKFNCFTTWINAGGRILEINTDANRKELDLAYTILDPLTGVETGESVLAGVRNINNYLPLPDNSGLVISYEKGVLVHKHGERKARLVSDKPNLNCNYFFPDGKTLLLTEKTAHETRGTGIVRLIDVAEGKETGEYYLDKGWELAWADISSRDQIVLKQWHEELDPNRVEPLRIADGRTGKIIRETAPVDVNFRANWTPDGRFLCAHNFFAGNTMLFDPETGATRGDFPPEGHNLVDVTKITWTNDWPVLFTLDSGGALFRWPGGPDSPPEKLLGENVFLRGTCVSLPGRGLDMLFSRENRREQTKHYWLQRIDNGQILREWNLSWNKDNESGLPFHHENSPVLLLKIWDRSKDHSSVMRTLKILAEGDGGVLWEGTGEPKLLTPDGRHFIIQSEEKEYGLYAVGSDTPAVVWKMETPGEYIRDFYASDNGAVVVVARYESAEVIRIDENYRRVPLKIPRNWWFEKMFTRDGNLLLAGGRGKAALFDAHTGEPVRSFVEEEKVYPNYSNKSQAGFLESTMMTVADMAGTVTDRFKTSPLLDACFAGDEHFVVTSGQGVVIRVWDRETGRLVRTIHPEISDQRDQNGNINTRAVFSKNGDYVFCHNANGYGEAALWSVLEGVKLRRYLFPLGGTGSVAVADDGSAVIAHKDGNIERWPGKVTK